jgi:hypothetical protein
MSIGISHSIDMAQKTIYGIRLVVLIPTLNSDSFLWVALRQNPPILRPNKTHTRTLLHVDIVQVLGRGRDSDGHPGHGLRLW